MSIAVKIKEALGSQSMIRKMFEEGTRLKKEFGAERVFDFSLGNPDLEPPPAFQQALLRLVNDPAPGTHGYMPNAGYPEVRAKLAQKAGREHGVELGPEHIIMSVGAAGALNSVLKSILNSGDEIVVPKPYFMEYRAYAANHGGSIVEAATNGDFSLNLAAIKAALSPKTAAVLINSPNNPTGRVYDRAAIAALAALLEEHGRASGRYAYLIADEPYRELAYDGVAVPPVLSAYRDSVVVTSYSKSLSLPGERIGYAAVNPAMAEAADFCAAVTYATRILGYVNAPALMQRVVAELTGTRVDIAVYDRRRAAFKKILDGAGISYAEPEGAFYLFAKVPPKKSGEGGAGLSADAGDTAFVDHLKRYRILGVPGSAFSAPGWLRFAYCVDEYHIAAAEAAFKQAMEAW
jgi:aspartate aminotransferase